MSTKLLDLDGLSYFKELLDEKTSILLANKPDIRELTQAQYDALTPAEKNNGTVYFITDVDLPGGLGKIMLNGIAYTVVIPSGGTKGQALKKKSDANYDLEWGAVESIIDVDTLPTTDIAKDTFYRKSEDVYIYQRQALDTNTIVWYGDGPNGFIEVVDEFYFTAYDADGDPRGDYIIEILTTQEVNSLLNSGIIAVKDSFTESKFFGTPDFFGFSELVTIEKVGYKLYHNPTSRPGKYIEVGEGSLVTSISSESTDKEYPSAKCIWDIIGDVETLINAL